jgi:hypothetical protein
MLALRNPNCNRSVEELPFKGRVTWLEEIGL